MILIIIIITMGSKCMLLMVYLYFGLDFLFIIPENDNYYR